MVVIEEPQIVLSNSFAVAATWRNLYVEHYRTRGEVKDTRLVHEQQRAFIERIGRPIVTLAVVPASVLGHFDAELREEYEQSSAIIDPHVKAGALAVLAEGFQGALMRTVLTTLSMVRRSPYPSKITNSVAAAGRFLAEYVDGTPRATPADVEAVYRAMMKAPPR